MNSSISTLRIHPQTGTDYSEPLYISPSGRRFYPIGGGAEPEGGGEGGAGAGAGSDAGAAAAAGGAGGAGGTDTFTAPASQEELNRIIETRLSRERAKFSDYDDLKTKATQFDALSAASATDQEKAVTAAREEERQKLTGEATPRLVKAEFKAAAKGVLTQEQLTALLEDLDLTKYVDDKGEIDEEKVLKKVTAFTPSGGAGGTGHRDLGQGHRQGGKPEPGAQGRAQAEKRFPKKS